MTYVVMANRTDGSVFGAASAPVKEHGEVVQFATLDAARAAAQRFNRQTLSDNVHYNAVRWDEHTTSLSRVLQALYNNGYSDTGILEAQFTKMNDAMQEVHRVFFLGDDGERDSGNVFVWIENSQLKADF